MRNSVKHKLIAGWRRDRAGKLYFELASGQLVKASTAIRNNLISEEVVEEIERLMDQQVIQLENNTEVTC